MIRRLTCLALVLLAPYAACAQADMETLSAKMNALLPRDDALLMLHRAYMGMLDSKDALVPVEREYAAAMSKKSFRDMVYELDDRLERTGITRKAYEALMDGAADNPELLDWASQPEKASSLTAPTAESDVLGVLLRSIGGSRLAQTSDASTNPEEETPQIQPKAWRGSSIKARREVLDALSLFRSAMGGDEEEMAPALPGAILDGAAPDVTEDSAPEAASYKIWRDRTMALAGRPEDRALLRSLESRVRAHPVLKGIYWDYLSGLMKEPEARQKMEAGLTERYGAAKPWNELKAEVKADPIKGSRFRLKTSTPTGLRLPQRPTPPARPALDGPASPELPDGAIAQPGAAREPRPARPARE